MSRKCGLVAKKITAESKGSIKEAIEFSKSYGPDAFLAVGGGSVYSTFLCCSCIQQYLLIQVGHRHR